MGGTVAVTLRKPDGTEYRMDRWTNSMPWGFNNMKLMRHDMDHVDEYLEQWLMMQTDYEKNKGTGKFENNMTECYFPSNGLAPLGYGLVVVDMVNNVILSMQGYTAFDSLCAASVSMGLMNESNPDSNAYMLREFIEAGQVAGVLRKSNWEEPNPYVALTQTYDEVVAELADWENNDIFDFKLDLSPFTLEEFEEYNPQALIKYRARLLELGFELTDKENEIWAAAIDEAIEEYGENDA